MRLPDTEQNTEFTYFFINKFKWLESIDNERFAGLPKEGRLYRGWKNLETNSYRIAPSGVNPFFVEKLLQTTPETGYTCDITAVSKDNILDLPLIEEDLDSLITWIESDNRDLKQMVFSGQNQAPPQIIAIIQNAMKPNPESIHGFLESAQELQELDPMAFDIVWGFMDHLLLAMQEPDESIDADWLAKGPNGSPINISNALKCLSKYAGDNRRVNNDPEDLYEAMNHITSELIRAELHEK